MDFYKWLKLSFLCISLVADVCLAQSVTASGGATELSGTLSISATPVVEAATGTVKNIRYLNAQNNKITAPSYVINGAIINSFPPGGTTGAEGNCVGTDRMLTRVTLSITQGVGSTSIWGECWSSSDNSVGAPINCGEATTHVGNELIKTFTVIQKCKPTN
ncbi:MAG: hypothetical protein HON90_04525 [Halobacteriovoraceae bacterium]|nr:hypothetical protein [Halobacteriovoraceae bacterium]